jgi:hypothetical protein
VNARGLQASNYGDEENTVIVKPIPIMETQYLHEIFLEAFKDGNFNSGKEFQYSSCVIDLDPEREALGIPDGKFPMTFTGDLSVNSGNQYKTSKIVLQRIDSVSGVVIRICGGFLSIFCLWYCEVSPVLTAFLMFNFLPAIFSMPLRGSSRFFSISLSRAFSGEM